MSQSENLGGPGMGIEGNGSLEAFNLQVVSPSVGVTAPLSFQDLPTRTTVKQLKEKIRDSLPIRPSDDQQRLIHRGRLLARENETMWEIFGPEAIRTSVSQTVHLVLKPSTAQMSSAEIATNLPSQFSTPASEPPATPPTFPYPRFPPLPSFPESLRQMAAEGAQRAANVPTNTESARETRLPTPPQFNLPTPPQQGGMPNEQADLNHQGHHHHHNPQLPQAVRTLQQLPQDHLRLHQEHRNNLQLFPNMAGAFPPQNPAQAQSAMSSFQNLVAQQQRDRAAMGMHGVHGVQHQVLRQDGNIIPSTGQPGRTPTPPNRSQNPQQHRTTTQHMSSPDGQRWTVIVNQTTTYYPVPNSAPHQARASPEATFQNFLRAADASAHAPQNLTDHREINSSNTPNLSTNTDEATNRPDNPSLPDNVTPMPLSSNNMPAPPEQLVPTTDRPSNMPPNGPTVYILSSPTGPRGLLVTPSENGVDGFYTPLLQGHWESNRQTQQPPNPIQAQNDAAMGLPEVRNGREGRHGHGRQNGRRNGGAAARAAHGVAHQGNAPAGAAAAQIWPHLWLVVRLLGFVWFFASGSNSWWRLFIFSAVAFVIFAASTGLLNGVTEQVWGPIRRHLENLLPLAAPGAPQVFPPNQPAALAVPAQGQGGGVEVAAPGAPVAEPEPIQTATRLLNQRRAANGNWVWTQFRRLEHATILFVASLVPGVGERHIAARVAEENLVLEAQRQRREAENTAAEEASRAAEAGQEISSNAPVTVTDTNAASNDTAESHAGEGGANGGASAGGGDALAQPLIEM